MERIKSILQHLNELYLGKHQKSAIDVDLMLDYTRVMYADLLEWRKEFKEPPTTETAEKNTKIITNAADKETAITQQPIPQREETSIQEGTKERDTKETSEHPKQETPSEATETVPKEKPEERPFYQPIDRDGPAPKEPEVEDSAPLVEHHPEEKSVNILLTDSTGISFEPPAKPETVMELLDELQVAAPTVNQSVAELPAPKPEEIPLPELASPKKTEPLQSAELFHAAKAANKDIRNSIGINDKYLFLNELFNNNKSNYEETLDRLNHFSTSAQAEDWIITKVAPVLNWEKEDATVQSFYLMLGKHFSVK